MGNKTTLTHFSPLSEFIHGGAILQVIEQIYCVKTLPQKIMDQWLYWRVDLSDRWLEVRWRYYGNAMAFITGFYN